MKTEPESGKPISLEASVLPYRTRLFFVVLIPNFLVWGSLAAYLWLAGVSNEFKSIAGPSGPGPEAGNGASLIVAVVVFVVGGFLVFSGILIPIFILTLTTSMRKFKRRRTAIVGGLASTIAGVIPGVSVYLLFKYNII